MDIVYSLKICSNCDELTYSLRSLRNVPHDKVFIVGGCPDNIRKEKIIHIPTEQTGTKWVNAKNNVKRACIDERLSDDFIYMNDDFFFMQPIAEPVKELNLYWDTMSAVYDIYFKRCAGETNWCKGMKQTRELLIKQGFTDPLCYDLHTPIIFNKTKFLKMFEEIAGLDDIPVLHWRSVYGNLYAQNASKTSDVKVRTANDIKIGGKLLSCSDGGFAALRQILSKLFSQKSEYEK